jgi:hypothetical protein
MLAAKHPFANTPPVLSEKSPLKAAVDVEAGKRLLKGRTRPRVETLTAQCEEARKSLADAKHAVGELASEGHDTTAALRELRQAHDRLDALEAALETAIQKDADADAALREAASRVKVENEIEAVARLKTVFLKADQLLSDLEALVVNEVGPTLNAARGILSSSNIRPGELTFLAEAPLAFKQLLLLSVHTLLKEGFIPVNMRKYSRVSDCIPDTDFLRSRERVG